MSKKKQLPERYNREELERYIKRVDHLLASDVFHNEELATFRLSVLLELSVNIYDLVKFCNSINRRLTYTDDIDITISTDVFDITEFLRVCRNALCHVTSNFRELDNDNQIVAFAGNGFVGVLLENDKGELKEMLWDKYPDDVTIFIGKRVLYLKHHLVRAFNDAKQIINQHYSGI